MQRARVPFLVRREFADDAVTVAFRQYLDAAVRHPVVFEYIDAEGNKRTRIPAGKRLSGIGWIRISSVDGAVTTGFYSYTNEMNSTDLFDIVNPMTKRVEEVKRANGVE